MDFFKTNKTVNCGGRLIDLTIPKVMGIINVTPDSFYANSRQESMNSILEQAEKMLNDGATFIDVGGYSSRPNSSDVSEEEELARVVPAIQAILKQFPKAVLSVDTFRSSVARQAVEAGAMMVNDISGGELDKKMFSTVAELKVPYLLMHMRGTPQTMTQHTQYEDLIKEVMDYFHPKIYQLCSLGVKDCIVDVGFGFSKTVEQNFQLLDALSYYQMLGKPLLVGISRKSMIWRSLNTNAEGALNGTTALHVVALQKGASILRVHDVKEAVEIVQLMEKLKMANALNREKGNLNSIVENTH
jgi:dihydropteroate synthase